MSGTRLMRKAWPLRAFAISGMVVGVVLLFVGLLMTSGQSESVSASHASCPYIGTNYLHIHWERDAFAPAEVTFKKLIVNESGGDYSDQITLALADWNNKQENYGDGTQHFDFQYTSGVADTYITVISDDQDVRMGWATSNPEICSESSTHLSYSDVTLNSHKIESLISGGVSTNLRQKEASHELGHSVGLGHAVYQGGAPPIAGEDGYAVMREGEEHVADDYQAKDRDLYFLASAGNWDPYGHDD